MLLSRGKAFSLRGRSLTLVSQPFRSTISTVPRQLATWRARLLTLRDDYEKTLNGKFVGDVDEKIRAELTSKRYTQSRKVCPCPCISTLRLDQATSRNQWFLVPAENPGSKRKKWRLSRAVIYQSTCLGSMDLNIPFSAHRKLGPDEWVTPYWNIELKELRFRLRSGRDLDYAIPFSRIGNKYGRALGKPAVAEGLIDHFEETHCKISDNDGTYLRAYNSAVQLGFRGSIEEWQKTRAGNRNGAMKIKTLIYEKGKETGQIFVPAPGKGTNRAVFVGGVVVGQARLPFPSLPDLDPTTAYCLDFDVETATLRFRTLGGDIIPSSTFSTSRLAHNFPALLKLARAEGLVKRIPDTRLSSFDLGVSLQQGFFAAQKSGAVKQRRDRQLTVYLGNGKQDWIPILLPPPPRPLEFYLIPYIDAEQKLRVWDTERKTDIEAKTGVYFREAEEVRRLSPELFAYAQSLGHWQNV